MRRIVAPPLPQISQSISCSIMSFDIDSENYQFVGRSKSADDDGCLRASHGFAPDQIFSVSGLAVALLLDQLSGEDNAFHVVDRQTLVVHLLFRMQRHDIEALPNSFPHPDE